MKDEKIKLQRIRMLSALGDLQLALSAADFLQEADENEEYSLMELRRFRCYEQTAIISYSRPFVPARGSHLPQLSLKMCSVTLTDQENRLHETVLELRNKLVAHSDYEMMNFAAKTHDMSLTVGKPFIAIFDQHDEGLHFCNLKTQIELIDLIRKVQYSLYKRLHDAAQSDPDAFNLSIHFPDTT